MKTISGSVNLGFTHVAHKVAVENNWEGSKWWIDGWMSKTRWGSYIGFRLFGNAFSIAIYK